MHYKLYTSIVSAVCMAGILLGAETARADGDPNEFLLTGTGLSTDSAALEQKDALRPDEQDALSEEAVATVTADGDFLLPTYLLPGETATVERETTVETGYEDVIKSSVPEVVINTPLKQGQEAIVRTKTTTVTSLVPAQVQTIPVAQPIPMVPPTPVVVQEVPVVSQDPIVPKVVVVQSELKEKRTPVEPIKLGSGHQAARKAVLQPVPQQVRSAGGKLLIPLAAVTAAEEAEPALPSKERIIIPSAYADQMTNRLKMGGSMPFKMPHEIRITFYPRASAFSGQTLKWVRAFAWAALQDPRLVVEIRASCAEADLQDRRLALIKGVLQGVGLSTHQIIVNYTDRPVDTVLLRAVPRPETAETVLTKKDVNLPKNMSRVKKW